MAKRIDIKGKVAGDDLRTKVTISGVPVGQSIVKAWLTIKAKKADLDASAIVQKVIMSGFVHTGTDPITCAFTIDLAATDTILCKPQTTYEFDVQIKTASGVIDTPIFGQIVFDEGVTQAIS